MKVKTNKCSVDKNWNEIKIRLILSYFFKKINKRYPLPNVLLQLIMRKWGGVWGGKCL